MPQVAFAQLSAEWPRLSVSDGITIDPHDRQEINDCARQESLAPRLRLSHRVSSLDKVAANDLAHDDVQCSVRHWCGNS
jgi:hypothetical protein